MLRAATGLSQGNTANNRKTRSPHFLRRKGRRQRAEDVANRLVGPIVRGLAAQKLRNGRNLFSTLRYIVFDGSLIRAEVGFGEPFRPPHAESELIETIIRTSCVESPLIHGNEL